MYFPSRIKSLRDICNIANSQKDEIEQLKTKVKELELQAVVRELDLESARQALEAFNEFEPTQEDLWEVLKKQRDEAKAENVKLKAMVREAYSEGFHNAVHRNGMWADSHAKKDLEKL